MCKEEEKHQVDAVEQAAELFAQILVQQVDDGSIKNHKKLRHGIKK